MTEKIEPRDTVTWTELGKPMKGIVQQVNGAKSIVGVWDNDLTETVRVNHSVETSELTLVSKGRA